jgi:hypothetical protein
MSEALKVINEVAFLDEARARKQRADSTGKSPTHLIILPKETPWKDIKEWDGVRQLAQKLSEQCSTPEGCITLEQWIQTESAGFIEEGCLALAAIAEIASQRGLPSAAFLLAKLLENEKTPSKVASIAAQRIRLFRLNSEDRQRLWPRLQHWLEYWEKHSIEDVVWGVRSVPSLGGDNAVGWLAGRIIVRWDEPKIVWAAVLGVTDWASGAIPSIPLPTRGSRKNLWKATVGKLGLVYEYQAGEPQQSRDLRVALIQCVGSLALEEDITDTAKVIVRAFLQPSAMEGAAAIHAAQALTKHFEAKAITALRLAFQGEPPETYDQFVALLNNIL